MSVEFALGQRWISNTEAELGLGVVERVDARQVVLLFPAASEQRIYSLSEAPITRVEYRVGDQIRTADERSVVVESRTIEDGCWIYEGRDSDGRLVRIDEWELDSFVRFSRPQDRLFSAQLDNNRQFETRLDTLRLVHEHAAAPGFGFLGPRVQLLPHQIYIATDVAARNAPRVLLADEVGLGKTIEAGLILHQQLISGQAQRALIVVPDALVHQWFVEMVRRLNLTFTILDEERAEELEASGLGNPFETAQLILCGISLLTRSDERHQQAVAAGWDLLVVDEAHHLRWEDGNPSHEYGCIETLARDTRGLLLLTATPEQLGLGGHFARLRLLDPTRYHSLEQFTDDENQYAGVVELIESVRALSEPTGAEAADVLAAVGERLGETQVTQLLERDRWQTALGDALLDQHGTGRVLFRNTREAVGGFPERRLYTYELEPPPGIDFDDPLRPELTLGSAWTNDDPRVGWLADFLREHRDDKVLLICERAQTAQALDEYLRLRARIRSAVFHQGLDLVARDRAAAYFADPDPEDGAHVLICSEIGSEGRNFQFAHHVVMFDLPRHPDLLEQRIGRLDRIGQRHDVSIHVPIYRHSGQAVLLRWYDEGLRAFDAPFPAAQRVHHALAEALEQAIASPTPQTDALIADTHAMVAEITRELAEGRNRLLELNSCRPERAEQAIEDIETSARAKELEDYMSRVFDEFGVETETQGPRSIVIRPGNHMVCDQFPALPEDGISATFSRSEALSREDLYYLTWEHPMVVGAIDMVLAGDFGRATLCTMKLQGVSPGRVFLEGIFILRCPARKSLRVQRYIPQAMKRFVIDEAGENHADMLTPGIVSSRVSNIANRIVRDVMRHIRGSMDPMVEAAEAAAAASEAALRDEAIAAARAEFADEAQRLRALQAVNPNVTQAEIDAAVERGEEVTAALGRAYLEFDSLRVLITTE
ncbi:MAG: RNA polymerase-associated protein RapA [Pseudomonadota bacterium]